MSMLDRMKWAAWSRWPRLMPEATRKRILELSPYVCEQLGQGEGLSLMRRDVFEKGGYDSLGYPNSGRDGENWIVREWMREHPDWRP